MNFVNFRRPSMITLTRELGDCVISLSGNRSALRDRQFSRRNRDCVSVQNELGRGISVSDHLPAGQSAGRDGRRRRVSSLNVFTFERGGHTFAID